MGRPEIVKVGPAVVSLWSRHVFTRSLINDSNVNIISLCGRRSERVRACGRAGMCMRAHSTQPAVYRAVISEPSAVSDFTECEVSWCIF